MPLPNTIATQFKRVLIVLSAVLGVGAVVGVVAGERALSERAGQLRTAPVSVRIDWPASEPGGATWMPADIQRQIRDAAMLALSGNPVDHASLEQCAGAITATGWAKSIESIRREGAGVVRITPRWRQPAAVVRKGETDYLVSTAGERLPLSYPLDASRLRFITSVYGDLPDKPGDHWTGGDVEAALALMGYLQGTSVWQQVAGIDAQQYVNHKRLVIVTDTGSKVIWGEAPGAWAAGEPSAETKLKWLMYLRQSAEHASRIDAGKKVIDVSNPRGILIDAAAVRPESTSESATEPKPGTSQQAKNKPRR